MIIAIACAALMQGGNPVTELIDSEARTVSVQAIVKLPLLTGREQSEMALIAETISDDVEGYSRGEMRNMAARAGDAVRITLMPDHLRIQLGVLPGDMAPAIGYIDQIVRTARFPEEQVNRAIGEIPLRHRNLWATGLMPYKYSFDRVRHQDLIDFYHRIFRPENIWLAVGGPVKRGEAQRLWNDRNADWIPSKLLRPSLDVRPLTEILGSPGRESLIELRGKEIPGQDSAIAVRLLAIIALGSGKGSAMFEALREVQGWSYRQEAILWPTVGGFVPRLLMLSGDQTPSGELANAMKAQLIQAVKNWGDEDAARARGMADGLLQRGFPMSPLYFNPYWPVTDSLQDRTFLAAYWPMKTGQPWQPRSILASMALATTEDMKNAALQILNESEAHVIFARDK